MCWWLNHSYSNIAKHFSVVVSGPAMGQMPRSTERISSFLILLCSISYRILSTMFIWWIEDFQRNRTYRVGPGNKGPVQAPRVAAANDDVTASLSWVSDTWNIRYSRTCFASFSVRVVDTRLGGANPELCSIFYSYDTWRLWRRLALLFLCLTLVCCG